eukprot:TRINITY_DN8266_c0_g2_i5.p1 TRINITY_DN8266_c0_g2~~TRINITY_DN8266_c0_g2_i5.p1  ORF type:complete len:264 (+),score=24.95 TRINITY_DN8266_c0_g2_i5:1069-1860(+)
MVTEVVHRPTGARVGVRVGYERTVSVRPENLLVPLPVAGWCHACHTGTRIAFGPGPSGTLRCQRCGSEFVEGTVSAEAYFDATRFDPAARPSQPPQPPTQHPRVPQALPSGYPRPVHYHIPPRSVFPGEPVQDTIVSFSFSTHPQQGHGPPPHQHPAGGAGLDSLLHHLFMRHQQAEDGLPPPAAPETLQALRHFHADASHTSESCTVCRDSYAVGDELAQMPCGHMYHTACLMPWLRRTNTCPTCRATLETPVETQGAPGAG